MILRLCSPRKLPFVNDVDNDVPDGGGAPRPCAGRAGTWSTEAWGLQLPCHLTEGVVSDSEYNWVFV